MVEPGSEWCFNLFHVERKKCLIITHQETLFTLFVPMVKRSELRQLHQIFMQALSDTLAVEGMRLEPFGLAHNVVIARTNSRVVLGSMNDFVFQCRAYLEDPPRSLREIRWRLNRIPMSALEGKYAIELFLETLR